MATIYDVAKSAGVSPATVSRVLNGKATVEPSLRSRVLAAVEDLHFTPSSTARSLTTKRTDRIALLIPDITNPYYPEITRGAQDALDSRGYHLILSNTDDNPERELRYVNMLEKIGVDGLIISPASPAHAPARRKRDMKQLSERLERLHIPIVSVSPEPPSPNADQVTVDEEGAAERAVQHLIDLGHRRIALINGPRDHQVSLRRRAGYERALKRAGIDQDVRSMLDADFRRSSGHDAMAELLRLSPRPTAVFAANDLMALGAIAALHQAKLRIPQDVAVIGVDNIADAADANPPLSTVSIPRLYEYGRIAANLLLDRLGADHAMQEPRIIKLETRLIVRESTVAPASSSRKSPNT
jgi:LacI family transcriptional regulator